MKYIIYKDGTAEIFECRQFHVYVAGRRTVRSAGFVDLENGIPVRAYGESTTLGIKTAEGDLQILKDSIKK